MATTTTSVSQRRKEKIAARKAKKKAKHEARLARKAARPVCPNCNQRVNKLPCWRCERDRRRGRAARATNHVMRMEQQHLDAELPELTKFPKGIKWTDNVAPVSPISNDVVDLIAMLCDCDAVREMDKFDVRYTVTDASAEE